MIRFFVSLVAALCVATSGMAFPPRGGAISGGGSLPTPVLIQHTASSATPLSGGNSGSPYIFSLPNSVQAGDVLVFHMTYLHGQTISITDSLGQTWPAAACVADDGSGNFVAATYVLPNSAAGAETITVTGTSLFAPFQYTVEEWSNIATTSPVNGTKCISGILANGSHVVDPGSFTPTNNNAGGGNLILNYTALASGSGTTNPTSYAPASGFTLLDSDIAWVVKAFYHGSQQWLQTTAAAVDPTMTITPNSSDHFNSVTVALKVASAGGSLPSSIHIRKVIHASTTAYSGSSPSWPLQVQFLGNARIITTTPIIFWTITGITDSDGNTYTIADTTNNKFVWYALGTSPSSGSTTVTIQFSGTTPGPFSALIYDVDHATAFDTKAVETNVNCNGVSSISNFPNITPTHATGLMIGLLAENDYAIGASAPSGVVTDNVSYGGEADPDVMDAGNGLAHYYNSTTAATSWTWDLPTAAGACWATVAAFH